MKFNALLDSLHNYEAGKPIELVVAQFGIDAKDVIKLASNENPHGVSPAVKAAVAGALDSMSLYPDDSMVALKTALSGHFNVANDNVIIGSGSDQIIELAVHAKCQNSDCVLMAGVTFAMYEIYAKSVGARIVRTKSAEHNLAEFLELYSQHKPSIIFICAPNNPLGECVEAEVILNFLQRIDSNTLVVLDGAYQEYAAFKDKNRAIDVKNLIARFPNVLYLGTFSKAYGLGGMRVGYGIAAPNIIAALHKLRPPFNITTLSLLAATKAIEQQKFVQDCVQDCFIQMRRYEEFCESRGIEFIPSFANFITLKLKKDSTEIANALLQKGLIVRNLASYKLNAIRITIGTESQNTRLLSLLADLLD